MNFVFVLFFVSTFCFVKQERKITFYAKPKGHVKMPDHLFDANLKGKLLLILKCFNKIDKLLTIEGTLKCNTLTEVDAVDLKSIFKGVQIKKNDIAFESMQMEINYRSENETEWHKTKLEIKVFAKVPAETLVEMLGLDSKQSKAIIQIGEFWPSPETLKVEIESTPPGTVTGFVKDRAVFVALNEKLTADNIINAKVTLKDIKSGITSETFDFKINVENLNWVRNSVLIIGFFALLGSVSILSFFIFSRQNKSFKETPKNLECSISEWNTTLTIPSISIQKAEMSTASSFCSDFEDIQVTRKQNLGIFLSGSVILADLPQDLNITI